MAEDSELWDVICDGPFVPTKNLGDPPVAIPKTRKEFIDADRKAIEKNFRAKKILVCGIGPNEYNRISTYQSAKEIWEALQIAHEGTTQFKQSKIDMLTTEYELFRMKDDESVQKMHTRFTAIINELHCLGETIPRNKLTESNGSSDEDGDMAYLTRRFQKMVRRNGGIPKKGSSSKPKNYDLCHKCGKPGHFIKDCPLKQDQYQNNSDKAAKRNPVPDRRFNRKNATDNVVRQALAAWGDSSSESGEDDEPGNSSMMAVESEATKYDSIFALMAQSNDEDDDDDEKLMSLANVLIRAYHSLINDKDALTIELGEAEQSRDDLVIGAVDLMELIKNLKKERDVLNKKIAYIEQERDDCMAVMVDLNETIESVSMKKYALIEKVASSEHERDDLLVVVMDLKKTIGELEMESRPKGSQKGKEALQGGSVSFGNGKNGYILGVGRIGKSLSHSIENVYYVKGLKYSLLSVSQICDKGNKVEFVSKICTVTNLVTGEVVLVAKRYKNIYVVDFESLKNSDLSCLSDVDDDAELWHRRLGHASFTLLN
ncbi:PREDICTED: uncharacterized protein LOC109207698 [Nicotiana attenuata]|uniref:uncharacterized protein LOC109207698 n=1 Tax=Nicotiana attenuata TaxID=49451 RepID=UPI000905A610|nr:PREDICTED: uncharacterized protein LOC109207698 [Nicotiana attenuata]